MLMLVVMSSDREKEQRSIVSSSHCSRVRTQRGGEGDDSGSDDSDSESIGVLVRLSSMLYQTRGLPSFVRELRKTLLMEAA